ncbi:phage major capsid protein [Carnobacteriaceae bacterium zg-ZUI78]|nr:phage major capsid protein [Carnobacteriaceae bacterium zg-ZUI78]
MRRQEAQLEELDRTLSTLQERSQALLNTLDDVETDEELDTLEQALEDVQKDIDKTCEERQQRLDMIVTLQQEIDTLNNKKPNYTEKGEDTHMDTREALNTYIRSKGAQVDGVKLVDGGALIQPEILKPHIEPSNIVDLSKLVNVVNVNTKSGQYPVIKKAKNKMVTVEELEKNPKLAKPQIDKVDFSISTYRGSLPISQEIIDDAEYDILSLLQETVSEQELHTKNDEISKILKTATAKAVTGLDGLKDVINKEIKSVYNISIIVSDSLFNELDKVKDKNGRYMLQPDITSPTGYKFSGKIIYKLPDDVIGDAEGDLKGFVGDAKALVTLFNRKQASVKWTDSDIYGQYLAIFSRFDVKKVDSNAGVYITYTA